MSQAGMDAVSIRPIGRIYTAFPEKFGIPRQSGIVETPGRIVLAEPFNDPNAVRGLEEFSHIWLIWQVSESLEMTEKFSPTVRPPRLGGNVRMGVFATRSPFHPNAMGLSCVKLESIEMSEEYGPILHVSGADILDGTPIYDIKPYVSAGDLRPEAVCGFVDRIGDDSLEVDTRLINSDDFEPAALEAIMQLIACDPRPRYQDDDDRVYGFKYGCYDIRFKVKDGTATILEISGEI